jgi:hypothetical protein
MKNSKTTLTAGSQIENELVMLKVLLLSKVVNNVKIYLATKI